MKNLTSPLMLTFSVGLLAFTAGCSDSDSNADNDDAVEAAPRFAAFISSEANGGGEILIDSEANLTWVNDVSLDTRGDGCVSPAATGPIEPAEAEAFCENQQFAGFTDWRAPTASELSTLISNAEITETSLNYLNPACPALVGTDGFVRTENDGNAAVASFFPNSIPGEILLNASGMNIGAVADLNGVNAGVRCVRSGTDEEPIASASVRFESRDLDSNAGGETLVDNDTGLQWVNDTQLDSNSDGCVSPANVGPTEPSEAEARCSSQAFAGFGDWRAPTAAELTVLTLGAVSEGATLKYLNPLCPALVGIDGIVRTENANTVAASELPDARAGDVLGTSLIDLPSGINAGVRCVRDI